MGGILLRLSSRYGRRGAALKRGAAILALALPAGGAALAAEAPRIVMLGDSLTAGYGLRESEGLVPQLQAWLDARGIAADLVNMGVSGDTTAAGLARLDWALGDGADAVVVALGGNDLLRAVPPAQTRENLAQILRRIGERGLPVLLVGLSGPANYGAAWKQAFEANYRDLAAQHGALLLPDLFAPLLSGGPARAQSEGLFQPDRVHPSARGVAREIEALGPKVVELVERVER